jgi:hypothetical protein
MVVLASIDPSANPPYELIQALVKPRRSASLTATTPRHEQCIELSNKFMRVFALTVPRPSDVLFNARRREAQERISGSHLSVRCPNEAESVAPLMPGDPSDHRFIARIV